MSNKKPVIIVGGGGHASVLADILHSQGRKILSAICPDDIRVRAVFKNLPHLIHDHEIKKFHPDEVLLINGIGILPNSNLRAKVNSYFVSLGYKFDSVIADSAIVSNYATLHTGVQILPRAVIQAGAIIKDNTIINTGAIVEHDCIIGCNNHIAPASTICGEVTTFDDVFIGANATLIQGISIAQGSIIGAGAIVTQNILFSGTCYPSPSTVKTNK
ncbi:sialic acid synthase [Proteus mirabilis]|uniref:acetyltransferase n=1 Tax=Enterobacterales TaxID=91347 RepID=UPI001F117892|nr:MULTISPECIES: acetyltransferase [Enterobacterales]MCH4716287.1 acetyltransferase [Escherichia coli]BDR99169.1 sialic acid synthase [Proteus mirabilis]HCJ8229347.1 acetyltransferase [Escherichia coli]